MNNRLLEALPGDALAQMQPALSSIALAPRDVLFEYDEPIRHVYFPINCVVSVVGVMADGSAVETATVGNEGLVGMPLFFGSDRMSAQAFCQVAGEALWMTAEDFKSASSMPAVRDALGRYTQALLTQIAQSAACNRTHGTSQRCARWLLQTHDRVHDDEFPLTQEFLAQMLGVRRAAVRDAASALQAAGALRYDNGHVTILNRAALESLSCECYAIIAREYRRLIEGEEAPGPLRSLRMSEAGRSTLTAPADEGDPPVGEA